ncbi:hypothetical protein [Sphingomonas sp.]|uniref:hypothetical protein n=1 Tax=Sphingomonas sp. TaxID=28214 RepID=UPI0035C85AB3
MTARRYATSSQVMNDTSQKASDSNVATTMPRIGSLGAASDGVVDGVSGKDKTSE